MNADSNRRSHGMMQCVTNAMSPSGVEGAMPSSEPGTRNSRAISSS